MCVYHGLGAYLHRNDEWTFDGESARHLRWICWYLSAISLFETSDEKTNEHGDIFGGQLATIKKRQNTKRRSVRVVQRCASVMHFLCLCVLASWQKRPRAKPLNKKETDQHDHWDVKNWDHQTNRDAWARGKEGPWEGKRRIWIRKKDSSRDSLSLSYSHF